jgi:arsenate reductase
MKRRAPGWTAGVAYDFHDYKAAGIERGRLEGWAAKVGWGACSTARHDLPQAAGQGQEGLTEKKAIALMIAQPSMIKRPVLDVGGKLLVGFKPEHYTETFRNI